MPNGYVPNRVTKFAGQYSGLSWDREFNNRFPDGSNYSDDLTEANRQGYVFATLTKNRDELFELLRRNVVGFDIEFISGLGFGLPMKTGNYPYIFEAGMLPDPMPYTGPGYTVRMTPEGVLIYSDSPAEQTIKNIAQAHAQWAKSHLDIVFDTEIIDPNSRFWTKMQLKQVYPHIPEE